MPLDVDKFALTPDHVGHWLYDVMMHSLSFEVLMSEFSSIAAFSSIAINEKDTQRPHDLIGPGNKLEWDVVYGLAQDYRFKRGDTVTLDYDALIRQSIKIHNQQTHHNWNGELEINDETARGYSKSDQLYFRLSRALDVILCKIENRSYKPALRLDQILANTDGPKQLKDDMTALIDYIQIKGLPNFDGLTVEKLLEKNPYPEILPGKIYELMQQRIIQAIPILEDKLNETGMLKYKIPINKIYSNN